MSEQPSAPLDNMQSAIQLAGFHYIACLKAHPTNADHRLKIEDAEYVFDAIGRSDSTALHVEFQRWAAMSVLRDLVENFSTYLMEVYGSAARAHPERTFSLTLAQFERKGIEEQLATLSKDFVVDAAWVSRLVGYNKARNCLAHRQGVVGSADTTDGSYLVVRWLVSRVMLKSGPITPAVEVAGPMGSLVRAQHVQGEAARVEIRDKEKRTAIGSVLTFLPADILEICQTFQLAAAAFSTLSVRN